jgi:tRNA (cmo5U34)-methyltransferase
MTVKKSSVEEIRARFDADVERFSNLETGQTATMDAALCLDLIASAASCTTRPLQQVLDVGCGAGNYALKLREKSPETRFTLVDLSRPMLDRAQLRLGSSAAQLVQSDLRDLEFAPETFDAILAAAVLHHLRTPEEWSRVFHRFANWLRPGGSLWVFDLVSHESAAVQDLMWYRYGEYLTSFKGPAYRENVLRYVEQEDTPTSLPYQLNLALQSGFSQVDVLHKNGCFAAYGAIK